MTSNEFVNKMIGVPWVNRGAELTGADCWGIVVLFFKHVHGISIPIVPGYADGTTPIADGFFKQAESGYWLSQSAPSDGVVFAAFHGEIPAHVGVITGGRCLHSPGSDDNPGAVGYHSIQTLGKIYSRLEFWRYVG
jgi:cell wall-associated NlpC family hydrolase